MTKSLNALRDDPDWCGHGFVSLKKWTCADCDRVVTPETRARLESMPTLAPTGSVWVLEEALQDGGESPSKERWVIGLFTDRAAIARLLIRHYIIDAEDIRKRMEHVHWYQGSFNANMFEGWEESEAIPEDAMFYSLQLMKIDHP